VGLDFGHGDEKIDPRDWKRAMKLRYAGLTHVGRKRAHNEDAISLLSEESLYMVADGMGGHASGEVASQMSIETISAFFRMTSRDEEVTWPFREERNLRYDENRLVAGIKFSNQRIYEAAARETRFKGMGTTIVSAFFTQSGAYLGHVGDSRGYRIRDDEIEQITDDHSLLNDYIKSNKLSAEEIENFPHKNVIVRALGMKDSVQVDINRLDPKVGDAYLLCSDGLSGMMSDEQMLDIVLANEDLDLACQRLVECANDAGGTDNITVALIHVVGD
jgi:PPM family protein phosphatase